MSFIVNRKVLQKELALLATVAERKSTIPVLGTTKFDLRADTLTLTATDMDTSLITSLPASGDEWRGCIPSKQLYELTRLLYGDEMVFVPEDGRVVVKLGKSKHRLPTYKVEQFPTIERPKVEMVTTDGAILNKALTRALRCVTPDAVEFWMQGVSLRSIEGKLYVVATNSRQTAISGIESSLQVDVSIPQRAVAALVKLITAGEVSIGVTENQIAFQQEGRTFTARLLDAKFPDWRPLVPPSFTHTITLDAEPARQAFRLAAITAYETALIPIPLRLTLTNGEMLVETRESDRGESQEIIGAPCATLNGGSLVIGVNGAHFINFLDDADKATFSFESDPHVLQLSPADEPNYRYITMALKV